MHIRTAARTAAATAAASLLFLPVTAGAEEPDQTMSATKTFRVSGVDCEIYISVGRYGAGAGADTRVLTDHPNCQDTMNNQVSLYYVTTAGTNNEVHGASDGAFVTVVTRDAQRVTRSEHYLGFTACDCVTEFTLSPK